MAQCVRHGWDPEVHGMPCPNCTNPTPTQPKNPKGALTNRLRQEWEQIDAGIRIEILDRWWELACEQLEGE